MASLIKLPKEDEPGPLSRKLKSSVNNQHLTLELAMKPWNVSQFEKHRSHMTDWARNEPVPLIEDPLCNRIVVIAPVKSGKREIVEYLAIRDNCSDSHRHHIFISSWHRTADKEQRIELSLHNMSVYSITTKKVVDSCIEEINQLMKQNKNIIIHLDECDYGSGEKQLLGSVYKYIRDKKNICSILYSATPEEVLFSSDVNDDDTQNMLDDMLYGTHVKYIPPPEYCGAKRFLEEGLVFEANPFFTMNPPSLTEQGIMLIEQLKNNASSNTGRNIATLRITTKNGKTKKDKDIYIFLQIVHLIPELKDVQIWVDKSDYDIRNKNIVIKKIDWSSHNYWKTLSKEIPILIVFDQTCSRSTELECHDRLLFTHDYRTSYSYAVVSQAQERVTHYSTKYKGGFQPIQIYGHKKTFQLSAGLINYAQYLSCEWDKIKIPKKDKEQEQMYYIKNEKNIHPLYPNPLTKDKANEVLEKLGYYDEITISKRLKGTIRSLPVFDSLWFPCNSENFDKTYKGTIDSNEIFHTESFNKLRNPFKKNTKTHDGYEQGYLRRWGVFDYEKDIKHDLGWGAKDEPRLTICYSKNVLGVVIRWNSGKFKQEDRLTAFQSMYPSKM